PKPLQKPHPRIWVAALQPATYQLAAELRIGVMALSVASPSYLAPHIKAYKERVRRATPVGKAVNDQWLSATMAFCDRDARVAGATDAWLRSMAIDEAAGVDELQFLMATETVPHDKVMSSIEMFGKYVIPELKRRSASTAEELPRPCALRRGGSPEEGKAGMARVVLVGIAVADVLVRGGCGRRLHV